MCAKQRIIATFRNKSHTVMITSVKVKFRASRVSGKAGTIYYQLTHLRRTRCITTGIRLMPGEWDASAQRAVSPEPGRVPVWQCRIECDVDRLHRIIRDLGREGRPYTVDEVADRFCAQSCGVGVTAFMREQIAQLTADNRLGTARNYTRTLRSFSGFLGAANCLSPRSPSGWSRSTTLTCCAAGSSGTPCRSTCASCARFTTRRSAGGWPSRRRRSAVSIRASTARANGPSTSGSSPV